MLLGGVELVLVVVVAESGIRAAMEGPLHRARPVVEAAVVLVDLHLERLAVTGEPPLRREFPGAANADRGQREVDRGLLRGGAETARKARLQLRVVEAEQER